MPAVAQNYSRKVKYEACFSHSLSVWVTGCNEVHISADLSSIHTSVTHDLLDQSNSLCCVCLIKEKNRVNPFALIKLSKLFCLHYFVPHILLCCSSMNLKFNIINAIIIGLKLLYLHDEHVSDTVYSSTSTACYHVTHEPNETSFTTSCLSHHNYWNVTPGKLK